MLAAALRTRRRMTGKQPPPAVTARQFRYSVNGVFTGFLFLLNRGQKWCWRPIEQGLTTPWYDGWRRQTEGGRNDIVVEFGAMGNANGPNNVTLAMLQKDIPGVLRGCDSNGRPVTATLESVWEETREGVFQLVHGGTLG